MITYLLDRVVPPGPVLLAGDETVTEHPGPKVYGKGRHRDGVRSTHSYTAYRWGRVVLSLLVKWPFTTRPWALPILVALYRPPESDHMHGMHHKTPAHIARLLLARLICWFPNPTFISTSYVERQNLTMRMNMRRFARLTNGFSKKAENHAYAVALHYMYYNFGSIHKTLRVTPAMAASVTDHIWTMEEIVALMGANYIPKPRGPYKKRNSN